MRRRHVTVTQCGLARRAWSSILFHPGSPSAFFGHFFPTNSRSPFGCASAVPATTFARTAPLGHLTARASLACRTAVPCSLPSAQASLACRQLVSQSRLIPSWHCHMRPHYLLKAASHAAAHHSTRPASPWLLGEKPVEGYRASRRVFFVALPSSFPPVVLHRPACLFPLRLSFACSLAPLFRCSLVHRPLIHPLNLSSARTTTCSANRARPGPCSAGHNAFANSANPSSLPGLPSLFPSASSFLAPPCSSSQPQEPSSAPVADSIASPCRTTFPPTSTRRPTRRLLRTFPTTTRAWPILTCSRASSSSSSRPSPIPHRTRTRRPRCSPRTPIRLLKASRVTRAIAAPPRAPTCRCRPSICRQYVCRMASSPRRNLSSRHSPWALHSHHRSTRCSSTIRTQAMRSPDSP